MKPDICIYHHPCVDGFTAAWAVHKRWPDIEFVPAAYGDPLPDVLDKHVLIVDFSYPKALLLLMAQSAASVTILDHHKTAQADLDEFRTHDTLDFIGRAALQRKIVAVFDMNRSGAMLAWNYCHPMTRPPALVEAAQDRDLWKFELPYTKEIHAYLTSYPFDFEVWDSVDRMLGSAQGCGEIIDQGAAILRSFQNDVANAVKSSKRMMIIGGHQVYVANLPGFMASDGAGALAEHMPFGASYYDCEKGRVFSLRVRDSNVDVSEIARSYGGGGHAKAAGFTAPMNWEGDAP